MTVVADFFRGTEPIRAFAPGRVNLLGEHTDYNDGYVLPIATPMGTTVAIAPSVDGRHHFLSDDMDGAVSLEPGRPLDAGFGRYINGCLRVLEQQGVDVPPLRVHVGSTLPIGVGLSSSAALEVATLRAVRQLLGIELDDVALALAAQKAEVMYAGVHCGIMDQMASSLCDEAHMLLLDTRTLAAKVLPLPADAELIVIDSGVARTLAGSKYNERRSECGTAARALGVPALRDVNALVAVDRVDPPYRFRARHVVSENLRVLQAAEGVSAERFGQLMNDSHASLRDDYEVSIVELDELTDLLRSHADVYGARLTGAGFGGACVALCKAGRAAAIGSAVIQAYNSRGRQGRLLIPQESPATSHVPAAAPNQPGGAH
ncbi:MAG: galactokinase [Gammaproteobacteria bacterium]